MYKMETILVQDADTIRNVNIISLKVLITFMPNFTISHLQNSKTS